MAEGEAAPGVEDTGNSASPARRPAPPRPRRAAAPPAERKPRAKRKVTRRRKRRASTVSATDKIAVLTQLVKLINKL